MNTFFKRMILNRNGQTVVLFAFLSILLIGFLGLAIDTGQIIYYKQKMQNAMDLSLLAGAQELADNPSHAVQVTKDYWEKNGFPGDIIQVYTNYQSDPNKISAKASKMIPFYFLPIVGIKSTNVTVSATAKLSVSSSTSSYPAFDYVIFTGSQSMDFKTSASNMVFDGKVHSNKSILFSGANNVFNSDVEAVNTIKTPLSTIYNGRIVCPASVLQMPQYDIAEFRSKATVTYSNNASFSGSINLNGITFVNGDVSISGGKFTVYGTGTIVATGKISISASGVQYSSGSSYMALYSMGDVAITGSNQMYSGMIYAPNGKISVTGKYNTFYGSLISAYGVISNGYDHFIYDERAKGGLNGTSTTKVSVGLIE